jgi:hypothetical protein
MLRRRWERRQMKAGLDPPGDIVKFFVVIIALAYTMLLPEPIPAAGNMKSGGLGHPQRNRVLAPKEVAGLIDGVPGTLKFYCGDKIVAPGDSSANVLAKCGEPAWREMWEDAITEAYLLDRTPVNFVTTEEWVYNFGSRQFLHFLRFQGDLLAVVETGGYGYDDRDFGRNCGNGRNISQGDRKLEVLVKCGEPMESAGGTGRDAIGKGGTPVKSDEWSYDFGPDSFIYIVKFRQGKVYDVRTGGYGH